MKLKDIFNVPEEHTAENFLKLLKNSETLRLSSPYTGFNVIAAILLMHGVKIDTSTLPHQIEGYWEGIKTDIYVRATRLAGITTVSVNQIINVGYMLLTQRLALARAVRGTSISACLPLDIMITYAKDWNVIKDVSGINPTVYTLLDDVIRGYLTDIPDDNIPTHPDIRKIVRKVVEECEDKHTNIQDGEIYRAVVSVVTELATFIAGVLKECRDGEVYHAMYDEHGHKDFLNNAYQYLYRDIAGVDGAKSIVKALQVRRTDKELNLDTFLMDF